MSTNTPRVSKEGQESKLRKISYIIASNQHCVKIVCILNFSGPYFPAFRLNTVTYFIKLRIQSDYGKIWARITPNTDAFYAVR